MPYFEPGAPRQDRTVGLLLRRQSFSGSLNLSTGRHSVKMRPNIGQNTLICKGKIYKEAPATFARSEAVTSHLTKGGVTDE